MIKHEFKRDYSKFREIISRRKMAARDMPCGQSDYYMDQTEHVLEAVFPEQFKLFSKIYWERFN